jgi:RNA polymerase sigma-70 factor (ECF subfamily)
MDEHDQLAERFEAERSRLRAVAYRMLGSASEADDAVQEAWLRLSRTDAGAIDNLAGWLTRVVSRLCLDVLRARTARREHVLEPRAAGLPSGGGDGAGGTTGGDGGGGAGPEHEAVLADSVGLALLVVLDRLGPAERVAFVLHDLFAVPFDEIAPIVRRTPVAAKKLASRARRRVHGASPVPAAELARQRPVVDAFLAAARGGDIDALLAVLAPDVVRRADRAAVPAGVATELRGARAVADETATNVARAAFARPALVAGALGIVVAPRGRLLVALALTVEDGRITEIDVVADPARLRGLDVAVSSPS